MRLEELGRRDWLHTLAAADTKGDEQVFDAKLSRITFNRRPEAAVTMDFDISMAMDIFSENCESFIGNVAERI